jgi:hypothetical protein
MSSRSSSEAARPHDHVVFTDFEGGEGVLVDLNTKRFYTLNETAALIWRRSRGARAAKRSCGG